jgi:hypothetical protein
MDSATLIALATAAKVKIEWPGDALIGTNGPPAVPDDYGTYAECPPAVALALTVSAIEAGLEFGHHTVSHQFSRGGFAGGGEKFQHVYTVCDFKSINPKTGASEPKWHGYGTTRADALAALLTKIGESDAE